MRLKQFKFLKNKKGIDFAALLLLVAIITLGQVYFVLENKLNDNFKRTLGEDQLAILAAYQKADNIGFYIDQSAKYARNIAMDNLRINAGLDKSYEGCDNDQKVITKNNIDFVLLNNRFNPTKLCTSNIYANFKSLFESEFEDFLFAIYESEKIDLNDKGFEFVIIDNKLYGIAAENFGINIFPKKTIVRKFPILNFKIAEYPVVSATIGRYITKPSFMIPFPYNLDAAKSAYQKLENIVQTCFKTTTQTTEGCVQTESNTQGLTMQTLDKEKGLYGFVINLIPNVPDSTIALYIPDIPSAPSEIVLV